MSKIPKLHLFGMMLLFSEVFLDNKTPDKFNIDFQQNDYKITYERADVVSFNKDYVQLLTMKTFKYNRTCTAFNVSAIFKIELGNNFDIIAQTYRFASNEYRLFPLRFQYNVCEALSKNVFGFGRFLACGNVTSCPVEKNRKYYICNFTPDESRFPPLVPNGRYMVEKQLVHFSNELGVIRSYFEITRPLTWT